MRKLIPTLTVAVWLTTVTPLRAANNYLQHNLVSDQSSTADHVDANLVNPWGVAFSAAGPFWVANQATNVATIYNSGGASVTTAVSVPAQSTAIVQNGTADFPIAPGMPATFLFASLNGTISGWATGGVAAVLVNHSSTGAIYTGLGEATSAVGSTLYAVNFHAGAIEVYDPNFNLVTPSGSFQDPLIPAGFVPYNIWTTGNKLYVTFAQQDSTKSTVVPGPGSGYVDLFDVNGSLVQHVTGGGTLNAPWGLAIAPAKFGDFAGALLVGNFGDGAINVFNISDGRALGTLANVSGQPLSIPGLRALANGNGTNAGDANAVYFTADTAAQNHGLFGSLQAAPITNNNGVLNGASFQLGVAPYTFVSVLGSNLAATTRSWQASDFVNGQLPRSLDGVSANINGTPAYVSYISPTQLNVLMPASTSPGTLQTVNNGVAGTATPLQFSQLAPAFFQFGTSGLVAATHADGSFIGPAGMFSATTKPARVGEVVVLYGNGFGLTNPTQPDGIAVTIALPLLTAPTVLVAGSPAQVIYAGLTGTGLYQLNIVIPQVDSGAATLTAQIGSVTTPVTMITIQ